jgi:hypothetical protein
MELHPLLILVLNGINRLASHIGHFTPKETGPRTHETGDYEYPQHVSVVWRNAFCDYPVSQASSLSARLYWPNSCTPEHATIHNAKDFHKLRHVPSADTSVRFYNTGIPGMH